jgi:hypothetical protein
MLSVRIVGISEITKTLRAIDKDIVNAARKDLRTGAKPVADAVRANIPTDAPLSGMVHNGRTAWKPSGVKVNVKTNFSKRAEIRGTYLVAVVAGAPKDYSRGAAAFQIADMAGRKRRGRTASGRAMISKLNSQSRASRYVYPAALRQVPYVEDSVRDTIKKLQDDYTNRHKR